MGLFFSALSQVRQGQVIICSASLSVFLFPYCAHKEETPTRTRLRKLAFNLSRQS